MNTDLTVHRSNSVAQRIVPLPAIDDAFWQTINLIVGSGLYGTSKEAHGVAAVKILWGRELGFDPISSLNGIHVIPGTPPKAQLSGNLIAAKIKASPDYDFTYAFSPDGTACCVTLYRGKVRSDDPSTISAQLADGSLGILDRIEFSESEAKKAGLMRPGGNWEKYLKDMLWNRCMSRARRVLAHLFVGVASTVEIIDAEDAEQMPMGHDQRKALFAGLKEADISDERRHAWASDVLGRPVETFSDGPGGLTRGDATVLLRWLDDFKAQEPVEAEIVDESAGGPPSDAGSSATAGWQPTPAAPAAPAIAPAAEGKESFRSDVRPADGAAHVTAPKDGAPAAAGDPPLSASQQQFRTTWRDCINRSAVKSKACVVSIIGERPVSSASDEELDAITALLIERVVNGRR